MFWIVLICLAIPGCTTRNLLPFSADVRLRDLDGNIHEPLVTSAPATALIFITNDCPISNGYAPEINRLAAQYQPQGVAFFLVHVDRQLSSDDARQHAHEYGYRCPVLLDPDHQLVKAIGATITPEAAVIDRERRLHYLGRIDNRYVDFGKKRAQPSEHDLREALEAALAGRPVAHPRTKAIGCYISDE